jgi:hypothetical protein
VHGKIIIIIIVTNLICIVVINCVENIYICLLLESTKLMYCPAINNIMNLEVATESTMEVEQEGIHV